MGTVFSKIINKEIPADIVYEDDRCLAIKDIEPQAPIHILVIPKKEIRSLGDASDEDAELIGFLFLKAAEIARDQGISEEGFRVVTNTNPKGGQSVYHLHIHLLGGRQMESMG